MIPFFQKSVRQLQAADVEQLVEEAYPEGYELEFKKTLPDKQGKVAGWLTGKNDVSEYARDEILSEVVAMANSNGGYVIVGIDETKGKPPRASALVPLPRVGELARRLEDQARSCIDPPLPRLEVHSVITNGSDAGVVVFSCGASRSAPHRLASTKDAYVRRASSTVRMTMREIQDMSLNVARGLEGISQLFTKRRSDFAQWGQSPEGAALRITSVPLDKLPDPGRLIGRAEFGPILRDFQADYGGAPIALRIPFYGSTERPLVRGLRQFHKTDTEELIVDQYQHGVLDLWLKNSRKTEIHGQRETGDALVLYHLWVLTAFAIMLTLIERFRNAVGAPNAEFAVELEIARFGAGGEAPFLYAGPFSDYGKDQYVVHDFPIVLPRLSVGPSDEFDNAMSTTETDLYDALGVRRPLRIIRVHW